MCTFPPIASVPAFSARSTFTSALLIAASVFARTKVSIRTSSGDGIYREHHRIPPSKLGGIHLLNFRNQLFQHLQRLSLSFFGRNEIGRIMSRVQNDVEQLSDFLDSGAFWVTGEILSLIAIAVAMFAINFTFALITLSVVPVLFTFILLWQKARVSFIRIRQAVSVVNSALQENVSGIRVIQNLSRENINARHFKAEIGGGGISGSFSLFRYYSQ